MLIDLRGLKHPEHIREFKSHFEGICSVFEDVEILLDNEGDNLRRLEMYICSFRGKYIISYDNTHAKVKILAPFSLCG